MPRENWHNAAPNPVLRRGLLHIDNIAPTARIARGPGPAYRFRRSLQHLGAVAFTDFIGATATLAQWLAASETDGYLALHRGDIVVEYYGNGLQANLRHNVMSVSKSFTGTLAALLIHQGALAPTAPVIEYIPELAGSAYAGVTVEQVLNMTSGVAFNANTADPDSDVIRLTEAIGWRATSEGAPRSLRAFLQSLTQAAMAPGAGFAYNDADTEVLAWVLERATGLPFPELLSREIWSRLGAEHDASISIDPEGVAVASAGLNATLRDLGRFALMLLQEGRLGARRILPPQVVRACRKGSRSAFDNERNALRVIPGLGDAIIAYSRQFWIFKKGCAMLGNNGQSVMILPDNELLAIKLSSIPNDKPSVIFHDQFNAYQAACAMAQGLIRQ